MNRIIYLISAFMSNQTYDCVIILNNLFEYFCTCIHGISQKKDDTSS